MAQVLCATVHPVDLDTGRVLAPGELAEDVDTAHPHNRDLVLSGSLVVVEGMTPRKRANEAQFVKAATASHEQEEG